MAEFLSPEEQFSDHLEIVSYLTIAASAIFWLVYFGMIFFYAPVRQEDPLIKLALLAGSLLVLGLAFLLLARKNPARVLFRFFFLGLSVFSYFHCLDQGQWWHGLTLAFSVYSLWVLSHPVGIGFFRKLRPWEERIGSLGGWLVLHQSILITAAAVMAVQGLQALVVPADDPVSNPETGALQMAGSVGMVMMVAFTRRLHSWARYALASSLGIAMLAGIPDTMAGQVQGYWDYWKALARVGYCGAASVSFFFSPGLNRIFKKIPPVEAVRS